ncbi:MAG: winged helix-turn-helix transcriptional regulator [Acidimicrobiales bacterium]|nr:winged helix-turn-helix transcriptional regulator [Acidimicrobiales bacterium]
MQTTTPTNPSSTGTGSSASASLERALTQLARAILRMSVPSEGLGGDPRLDRAGYWLLVRVSEHEPVRLSELAEVVGLDLSTVSRQVRDLVEAGLVDKVRDPLDGRASLLSLTAHGAEVLETVSAARRQVIADAVAGWTDEEKEELAERLVRLGEGLPNCRPSREAAEERSAEERAATTVTGSSSEQIGAGGDRP